MSRTLLSAVGSLPKRGAVSTMPAQTWDWGWSRAVSGILARDRLKINHLHWDKPAGCLSPALTSGKPQTLTLRLPQAAAIKLLRDLFTYLNNRRYLGITKTA